MDKPTDHKIEELKANLEISRADIPIGIEGIQRCLDRIDRFIELSAPLFLIKREVEMVQYRSLGILASYEALVLFGFAYKDEQ